MQREGEAHNRVGADLRRGTAGHSGSGTAPTGDQRRAVERREHIEPRCVEALGGLRDPAAPDPPGLLDEGDTPAEARGGGGGRRQVGSVDASTRTVAEDEQWPSPTVPVHPRESNTGLDVGCLGGGDTHLGKGKSSRMGEPDVARSDPSSVATPESPYWTFYEHVAAAQLAAWLPRYPIRVLELSGHDNRRARQLRDAGHRVLRVDSSPLGGALTVNADPRSLTWLHESSVDAVVAESRVLSTSLATEETVADLVRVVRPGGRLLLVVDSLLTGLARLADLGRWAELADVPSADVVLVPAEDGTISRCFWPEELSALLSDAGLVVDWVRPRSVLTPASVEHALAAGNSLRGLVRTELRLSEDRAGEAVGIHLVASAVKHA